MQARAPCGVPSWQGGDLAIDKESYGKRRQVELGLHEANVRQEIGGGGSNGANGRSSGEGKEKWASPKVHLQGIGQVQGCTHQ